MISRNILLLVVILCFSCTKDEEPAMCNPNRPNILLIIADDMGVDACPNYPFGDVKPNMPHLEGLMANGLIFDNAWAYPVCAPSRAAILTGKYGVHNGVLNVNESSTIPSSELTLQSYLNQNLANNYSHGMFGKWHLSQGEPNRPNEMGIDHFAGILGGAVQNYNNWSLLVNGATTQSQEYITTELTNFAIDWINEQEQNWFCWMGYNVPHTPFHLPPDSMHFQGSLPTDQASIDANPLPYYMAMMESLDFEIGRLMDNIPSDELENTCIIFIGDNGTAGQVVQSPFGNNNSKGSMKQGGIHVPFIVSGSGVSRTGQREESLVGGVDIFASVAELTGINISSYEDSKSFVPLLRNDVEHSRNYNYSEILNLDSPNMSGYTIRNNEYKLINRDNGTFRFYNLVNDPSEENNISMGMMTDEEELIFNNLNAAAAEIRN